MDPTVNIRNFAAGGALLLAALSGHALTLGAMRGAALVGQPLDVSVPVALEAGEDASSLCFDGDVLYADTRLGASRVSIAPQAASARQEVIVRIRSTVAVDEPVVTVNLRVGCAGAVTRRYVLLADAPNVAMVAPASLAAPGLSQSSGGSNASSGLNPDSGPTSPDAGQAVATRSPGAAPGARRVARSHIRRPPRRRVAHSTVSPKAAASTAGKPAREEIASNKARLKLDLLAEPAPDLRVSSALQRPPAENDPKRAEAAAMWRTLNVQPQDALHDALRMQALEADMNTLRAQSLKNQASLLELSIQLQRAADRRFSNALVYALLALLAAAVGVAAYLGWQMRRARAPGRRSWRGDGRGLAAHDEEVLGPLGATIVSPLSEQLPQTPSPRNGRFGGNQPMAGRVAKSGDDDPLKHPPARPSSDFSPSMAPAARAVNAEELFDIQQQADFFVSLGQHEQAIELLRQHIGDNTGTSPLAYLDLLGIYHRFDLRDDYERLRVDFTRAFNVQVPPFGAFSDASKGLEAYPAALSRIEALWPCIQVLDVIEASIFRRPGTGDAEGEPFDPEAYRELLLLFSIAREVAVSTGADKHLAAPRATATLPDTVPPLTPPPPSPRLGLDIDLSDPCGP
ncbi:hypothetical protein B0E49_06100 [Polaromonas sp. C04]|nr:hypothetical protein B0E49_06100 [Polaromonas sp. C04]